MSKVKWHKLEQTDSTNSYLSSLQGGDSQFDYEVAVTQFQNAGRGQRGNSWESEGGKNLLFSILTHPNVVLVSEQFYISQAIALAVIESVSEIIEPLYTSQLKVKWPNDIYWNDCKLGGILIENTIMGNHIADCIVGVGLNVNQNLFLSDAPNPISIKMITAMEHDCNLLLERILNRFVQYMDMLSTSDRMQIDKLYRDKLYRSHGWHQFGDSNGEFEARIKDILADGRLVLEMMDGAERAYEFKQVKFII